MLGQTKHKTGNQDLRLGLILLLGSGTAALGHEILWTRRMSDLLGASPAASARVFECFFLGLSLGAATMSLLLPRIRRRWFALGVVELGVATFCIPALFLSSWTAWIWPRLGPESLVSWQGSAVKTALSILVILPPTLLMGLTLPLMVSVVGLSERSGRDKAPYGVLLYGANTLGGVLGLALVVLILLQMVGANGSMLLMIVVNLVVAARCFKRSRQDLGTSLMANPSFPTPMTTPSTSRQMALLTLSFFSGAAILSLEVLGLALANLSAPLSFYPQSAILGCVIFLLGASSLLVGKLRSLFADPLRNLPVVLAISGLSTALVPVIFMNLPGVRSAAFGYGHTFGHFLCSLIGDIFLALGPAIAVGGAVFPCLVASCAQSERLSGRRLGVLLAVNGLGAIAGAEIAYRWLLPAFAVHVSVGIIGACYGLVGLVFILLSRTKRIQDYIWIIGSLVGVCCIIKGVLVNLPVYYGGDIFKVIDLRSGREGSLAVAEDAHGSRAMIFDNQYTLGGTGATGSMRRQAHLPLLLHPAPEKVAFIGLGTGITVSGALEHEAVRSITAIELSPLVMAAAERNFGRFNHDVCRNSRVKVRLEDARIYLEAAPGQFDVIIGDLFIPWRPGEASLSSLEQFRAARNALRPGGVFCQWIELTQWTPEQFRMAAATFRKAFGELHLLRTGFSADSLPLGFLGFKGRVLDWGTVTNRCSHEAHEGGLVDPLCRHPEGVAMLYLGTFVPSTDYETRLNTLGNLRIELSASRQVVAGDPESYYSGVGDAWLNLIQSQSTAIASRSEMPEPLQFYPSVGNLVAKFEISLKSNGPGATALAESVAAQVPANVAGDIKADWLLWPGTRAPWDYLGIQRPHSRSAPD